MSAEHAALRAMGLTDYGAKAYAGLLGLGGGSAPEVAAVSGVPRTRIYSVLQDLARKGWVDSEDTRPKRFFARKPSECFDRERGRLDQVVAEALPELEARHTDRTKRFAGALWLVEGGPLVGSRAVEMIRRARREVHLVASFPVDRDVEVARELRAAARRDVRIRVITPSPEAASAFLAPGVEARTLPVPPRALLVDGREALIVFPDPEGGPLQGIWHASGELMQIMGRMVGFLWAQARPVEVRPRRRRVSG